ncbi:MAG TPA: cytochrome c [Cyclobacteriaceae bacterium]|nr:cytochrome c [Cyclobacteriaceae bacterium]
MFNRHPVAVSCLLLAALCFVLSSCSNGKNNNEPDTSSVKFDQYYLQGQALYINHCSNCHQKNGTGLGRVYPPLDKSDFMNEHFEEAICLMRYGKTGEIIVNGNNYVQGMPGIPSLTDLEIAEIATYIFNTWDHKKGIIEVKDVSRILNSCKEK